MMWAYILCVWFGIGCAPDPVRQFDMGFTPFHYSWIESKLPDTYAMIEGHSDLIAHHFDEGVPWPEMLTGAPLPSDPQADIAERVALSPDSKTYVSTTPINFGRNGLADYWSTSPQQPLPAEWQGRALDNPEVVAAYINWCRYLIDTFSPDYFAYGIEVNLLALNDFAAYQAFINLAAQVYPALKAEYPGTKIFTTFYVLPPEQASNAKLLVDPLVPYTDLYAISTYPYMGLGWAGFPESLIPSDWFSQAQTVAPTLPFAIAETGFVAEDFEAGGYTVPATAADQDAYVERLLTAADDMDAEFVVWFVVADYDELWTELGPLVNFNPLFRAWKDTGLFDGNLTPRPALTTWDDWLSR